MSGPDAQTRDCDGEKDKALFDNLVHVHSPELLREADDFEQLPRSGGNDLCPVLNSAIAT
jgi:hypothetical protein